MSIEQRTIGRSRKYVYTDPSGKEHVAPSVTTVLGVLPKDLSYWGFKLGVSAVHDVLMSGDLDEDDRGGYVMDDLRQGVDHLYEMAKKSDFAPYRALKKAGNRGTDVHNVAEVLLANGTLPDLPEGTEADEKFVDALVKWYEAFEVASWTIEHVEARLFSTEYLFAGTTDFIARRPDGVWVVGDFKTSKGVYESHLIQTAAYAHAAVEMGLIPVDVEVEQHVIRLGVDGEFEVYRSAHTIEDFAAVLKVFHLLKDKTKKGVKL